MKYPETLSQGITRCVLENITFPGLLHNSRYKIQAFTDGTLDRITAKEIAKRLNKRLSEYADSDLFGDKKQTREQDQLKFQVDLLVELIKFLEAAEKAAAAERKLRKVAREKTQRKLETIREAMVSKETDEINKVDITKLQEMEAELMAELEGA